jgi:hypothetical protein
MLPVTSLTFDHDLPRSSLHQSWIVKLGLPMRIVVSNAPAAVRTVLGIMANPPFGGSSPM